MRHITLTTKKDKKVILHPDTLKEAFPTEDDQYTICVLDISNNKSPQTFMVVKQTVDEIESKLKECSNNSE